MTFVCLLSLAIEGLYLIMPRRLQKMMEHLDAKEGESSVSYTGTISMVALAGWALIIAQKLTIIKEKKEKTHRKT